jgi:exodeoxyribonuclease VII small subunit
MPENELNKSADKTKQPSFEESLRRLEEIVASMESEEPDLDTMIKQFEEGQKLISLCQKRLTEVERRVEALVKNASGELETAPFEENPDN